MHRKATVARATRVRAQWNFNMHQYVSASVVLEATYHSQNQGLDHVCRLNNDIHSIPPEIFGGIAMTNMHLTENLTIHLKVKDYATWRTSYNGNEKSRLSAGVTNGRVFRNADDQNELVILQDVADVAKARTWLGSEDMKTTMLKSGVVGSPNIRFAAAA
jgi:hypothetical protein